MFSHQNNNDSLQPSSIETLIAHDAVERLAECDETLFSDNADVQRSIKERLGWVTLASDTDSLEDVLQELRDDAHSLDLSDVVLIGMGGSSLATRVLGCVFEDDCRDVRMHVLDTTCAQDIAKLIGRLNFATTLFIVSSKSGSTTEPIALGELFFHLCEEELSPQEAPKHFIAITDKGTPLSESAEVLNWRHVLFGRDEVGGRFSALSVYGLVPALYGGVDIERLIESARYMETLCRGEETFANPGAQLASYIHDNLRAGRDKLMLVFPEDYRVFGKWLEQLIAESLGKDGKGVIPIITSAERMNGPIRDDACVFVMREDDDGELAFFCEAHEESGPVFEVIIGDNYDIGAEFVRWEFAVALLGFLMGVNPFDQPDVAASKEKTKALLAGEPYVANPHHLNELASLVQPHDYLCLLTYLPHASAERSALIDVATKLEAHFDVPVIITRGPRYLHSTGQLYKGGPNNGVFIVIGDDEYGCNIALKDNEYSMRDLFNAQRKGDIMSLIERGRRVFVVHDLDELTAYVDAL